MNLAQNPNLNLEVQKTLANSKNAIIRYCLAFNSSLHLEVQKIISLPSEYITVKRALAQNRFISLETQETLAFDESPDVRNGLARNKSLHPKVLKMLKNTIKMLLLISF